MKKSTKKFLLIFFALLTAGAAGFILFLLSGRDVGCGYFRDSLVEGVEKFPGWTLDAESFCGNPLFGFTARAVKVSFEDDEVLRADGLKVSLSLLSLLKGAPEVAKVEGEKVSLNSEELFSAVSKTNLPRGGEKSLDLPIVVLTPSEVSTPLGVVKLSLLRLTPGQGTVTFEGAGAFQGAPLEIGGSLAGDEVIELSGGYFRTAGAAAALEGELFPEFLLEGGVRIPDLERIASLLSAPFTMKGAVRSSLTVSRPGGKLLVSGEGSISGGDIWDLLAEGQFLWSADGEKAMVIPAGGTIFSSPARGNIAVFFGDVPQAEIKLGLRRVDFMEWTRFFSWLSFGDGVLSYLRADLGGPFEALKGAVTFAAKETTMVGFPVKDLKGALTLNEGKTIDLSAEGKWMTSPFSASGKVTLGGGGTETTVEILSEELNLRTSAEAFGLNLPLEGVGRGVLALKYPLKGKETLSGNLSVPKFSFMKTGGEKLSAAFSGGEEGIAVSNLSFAVQGGTVTAKGTFADPGGAPVVAFEGEGKNIPWTLIESLAAPSRPLEASGRADLKWSARMREGKTTATFDLKGRDEPLSALLPLRGSSLKGTYSGDGLTISDGTASLWGGKVTLSGKISSLDKTPLMDLKGSFSGLDLRPAAADLGLALRDAGGTLNGTVALAGKGASPTITLALQGPSLSFGGVSVEGLSGKVEGTLGAIKLSGFTAKILGVPASMEGGAELKKGGKVNLSISAPELDLRRFTAALGIELALAGKVKGKLSLEGVIGGAWSALFSAQSPLLSYHGLLLEKAKIEVKPAGKGVYKITAGGDLGEADLALEGRVAFLPGGTEIELKNSKKINLAAAAAAISTQAAGVVSGEADFTASGVIGEKSMKWQGRVLSPALGFYNTEARDIDIPLTWEGGPVVFTGGKGNYYGGRAAISGKLDPSTMRWEGDVTVEAMDLEKATSHILAGRGKITGKGDLTMRGNGGGGIVGMVFGSGKLSAKDGVVSGFEALKGVADSGEVPFSSVMASFNLDGRSIFLLPGSRVSAPPGNDVYRYFSASGSLGWNESPLDLKCTGDINVRALNAFLGALQGFIAVDGNPLTDPAFLQKFLTGLLGGMSVRDFRETSFNLKGTLNKPVMMDLKVTSPSTPAVIPKSGGGGKDETKIKITVEIPTGEGKDTSPSTEDQVKKQLLENIMKQIIKPGIDDDRGE